MAHFFRWLVFHPRDTRVRGGVVSVFTNLLLLAALLFCLEVILIVMGIHGYYLPVNRTVAALLEKIIFLP